MGHRVSLRLGVAGTTGSGSDAAGNGSFALPPDAYAIVMATGIVAVAADEHGHRTIGEILGALATAAFAALTVTLVAERLASRRPAGATDPDLVLRRFTFVAAAAVLVVRWHEHPAVVWPLAALTALAWTVLASSSVRAVCATSRDDLRAGVRGAWLLGSVATSALATTAATSAQLLRRAWPVLLAIALWALALVVYALIAGLMLHRAAGGIDADLLTPDMWILMGALAIATLTGSHLVDATEQFPALNALAPGLLDVTVGVCAVAALWVPALVAAQLWRFCRRAGSWRFSAGWWSAVFPLGMYSAATASLARLVTVPGLPGASTALFWIALATWTLVATGLVRAGFARMRPQPR